MRGGADFFYRLTTLIDRATQTLHLQTYIMEADETGMAISGALIRAAQRGVAIYLLLDGFASRKLPASLIKSFTDAGIRFGFFQPLLRSDLFYVGRRLHHKLVVADAGVAMVAGINVCNRYNDMPGKKGWLDWAIHVEGDAARELHHLAVHTWNRSVSRVLCPVGNTQPAKVVHPECLVRVRCNDWVYHKTDITRSYHDILKNARREVTIMTSYFWPPWSLLKLMAAATERGVQVRLILTARADEPLSKYTERYLYHYLLRHQIRIFEYETNILHGKVAVCDGELFTMGSYNMNALSAFASVELNLDVKNKLLARELDERLQQIIDNDCIPVSREDYRVTKSPFRLFLYFLAYRATMALFFLFTFYYRQKREP